ncbi:MAG: DUF3987 domain-containing protein [Rhodospirillales bacterium]|nr:DUF3987 domain-containing protein [Rhodospirillales bacterium]
MPSHAFYLQKSKDNWRDPDLSVLDRRRGPVPAVPLALLPQPWRDWIIDTERATGAPADYVLQAVLAGVAAMCGAGVRVRVTPAWDEPLVLWLAAVGEPSTGKSAALAPMRRLLDVIEQELQLGDEERRAAHDEKGKANGGSSASAAPFMPSQVVAADADPAGLADIVAGNPRGLLLWRDGPAAWIGGGEEGDGHRATWRAAWDARAVTVMRPRQPARSVRHFPLSIIETIRPEPLKESLCAADDGLAARFLFAWPGPQPYRALEVLERSRDEEILQRLRALSRLARSPDDPCVLEVDARGRAALDGALGRLHAERQKAEGPEATWLGLSRSLIVRLAGALELLGSIDGKVKRPGTIGTEQVEAAATLWRDYYWPHAKAVFDSAELSDHSKRVRRVARWLLDRQLKTVSREDIRRRALSMSATADETESVLQRLHYLGFVQPDLAYRDKPGRPTTHWLVNPALAETAKPVAEFA